MDAENHGFEMLQASALVAMIKAHRQDFEIIDVREEDVLGGHIPGSFNIPAAGFHAQLSTLADKFGPMKQAFAVVFHCQQSQIRGPNCATELTQKLSLLWPDTAARVYLLDGGFEKWVFRYHGDSELVQDYIPSVWTPTLDALSPLKRHLFLGNDDSDSDSDSDDGIGIVGPRATGAVYDDEDAQWGLDLQ